MFPAEPQWFRAIAKLMSTLLTSAGLVACADSSHHSPAEQDLAASVGSVVITSQDIDLAWRRVAPPNTPPQLITAQRKAILADWVRMEALAQRALEDRLDEREQFKTEAVLAQRRTLALQVEREAQASAPGVTPIQVRMVIERNPLAFARRQYLTIEELTFTTPADPLVGMLIEAGRRGDSFESLEQTLKQSGVVAQRSVFTAGTGQLRPELVTSLLAAKPGEALVSKRGSGEMQVLVLRSAIPAPLIEEAATLAATALLNSQIQQRAVKQRVDQVVSETAISYFGEFSEPQLPATIGSESQRTPGLEDVPSFGGTEASSPALPTGLAQPITWKRWRSPGLAAFLIMASALAFLLWVMVVRRWVGSLWLPILWPHRDPHPPSLLVLIAQHVVGRSTQLFDLNTWMNNMLMLAPALISAAMFWQQIQISLNRLDAWIVAGCVGTGLFLGMCSAHAFGKSRWRTATRNRLWLPVFVFSILLALAACGALLMFA